MMTTLAALYANLTPTEREVVAELDAQRLELERSGLSPEVAAQVTTPIYGVLACLRMWDHLVRDMESAWADCDYYMVYEYLNILDVRSSINEYLDKMPVRLQHKLRRLVTDLDNRFREVTEYDGGAELRTYSKRLKDGTELGWWWFRKPNVLPPGW